MRRLGQRFPLEALISAGLAMRRDTGRGGAYDRFRDRLMIPLIAPGGAVVGFGARSLAADQEPKYLNSPETGVYRKGSFLFGFEQARRVAGSAGELIVVEELLRHDRAPSSRRRERGRNLRAPRSPRITRGS